MVLSVAEQVTAATQQRELQESGNSDELQLELTPQHQSTSYTGAVFVQFLIYFLSTGLVLYYSGFWLWLESDQVSLDNVKSLLVNRWIFHMLDAPIETTHYEQFWQIYSP